MRFNALEASITVTLAQCWVTRKLNNRFRE